MQRQRSILTFFPKPSLENQIKPCASPSDALPPPSSVPKASAAVDAPAKPHLPPPLPAPMEIRGTDTPPEKPPRPFVPARFASGGSSGLDAGPFASIMRKFVREVKPEADPPGFLDDQGSSGCCPKPAKINGIGDGIVKHEILTCEPAEVSTSRATSYKNDNDGALLADLEPDTNILGPETPLRPFVPHLKRIQEEHNYVNDKQNSLLLESSKRMKLHRESEPKKETTEGVPGTKGSKFEWLNPSCIRDANGRRPDDPLYDKKTLYIPPDALAKMSASQKQYWSVKCHYMDVLLFFKVGKFYELYEIDAEIGHKELDWKMTHSGVGKCRQVGISESGIEDAVQKLLSRGYKVGRMEQTETAGQAKARGATSVIQRKLVHVLTPSTMTDGCVGPDAVHLLALKEGNRISRNGTTAYGFAFVDCSALKFWVGYIDDDPSCAALGTLLMQVSPKEILYEGRGLSADAQKAIRKYASIGSGSTQLTPAVPGIDFHDASELMRLIDSKGYFRGSSTSWSSIVGSEMHHDFVVSALGILVDHLSRLMLGDLLHNGDILPYHIYKGCLRMDGQTLVNLEIFSNNINGGLSGTLYKHLDHCLTSSGKRLLRKWICHPLRNIEEINDRLNVVEGLIKSSGLASLISEYLRRLPDLERLLGRVKASLGSSSTLLLPLIGEKILKQRVKSFGYLVKGLRIGIDLLRILQKEGQQILSLQKVLNCPMIDSLQEFLCEFEAAMDDNFPDYQDHDVKDSDAETLRVLVELFTERSAQWSQVIHALNCVDVLQSFAITASTSSGPMSRPVLLLATSSISSLHESKSPMLEIRGLWHPYAVGENGGRVVPNDIYLGGSSTERHPCTLLLTGPNMGGKSTLLRATCLAAVLAQLGCYVPCGTCILSIVDVIFTRLGATDHIMSGESTFFVECAETSSVLQNATQDSLVLLDELGRGTSTFDGYAIAYAVLRHLVENVNCRLLFATHYHSLTKEFSSHPHVNLQHMACVFRPRIPSSVDGEKELIFLYQLASGACPESYGLQVALVAGIPPQVVEAASKASQRMKTMIKENFRSSEGRSEFSTLHEEWLKTLVVVSSACNSCSDEDTSDTLLCLWHELKSFYRKA